jgi:hypothetical protein
LPPIIAHIPIIFVGNQIAEYLLVCGPAGLGLRERRFAVSARGCLPLLARD